MNLTVLPPIEHFALASKVIATTAEFSAALATLPASARDSLAYFEHVAQLDALIKTEQGTRLAGHREAFIAALGDSDGLGPEVVANVVDALFSSYAMAALVADIAAGNIHPIAGHPTPVADEAATPSPAQAPAPAPAPAAPQAPARGRQRSASASKATSASATKPQAADETYDADDPFALAHVSAPQKATAPRSAARFIEDDRFAAPAAPPRP